MANELLRKIPKIDEILCLDDWQKLIKSCPEEVAKDALRQYFDELRAGIKERRCQGDTRFERYCR